MKTQSSKGYQHQPVQISVIRCYTKPRERTKRALGPSEEGEKDVNNIRQSTPVLWLH